MLGRLSLALVATLFFCWQSGCVSWQEAYELWSPSAPASDYLPSKAPPNTSEMARMKPGEYARFEVLAPPSDDPQAPRSTNVAGRIVAIDDQEVVLTDGIRMEPREQVLPRGPLAGVPGLNRLNTSTGIVMTPKPLEGEVRLPRPDIASASPIPAEAWELFKQPREVVGAKLGSKAPPK
jgi:hypothetical protein